MDKKLLISAVAGAIAYFLLGWLVFGILLDSYYKDNMTTYEGLNRPEPLLLGIFLGGLAWTSLLAYVFTKFANVNNFASGFTIALIMGVLVALSIDFFLYSTMNLYRASLMAVDVAVNGLFSGIIGGIMGWVIGMSSKTQTASA